MRHTIRRRSIASRAALVVALVLWAPLTVSAVSVVSAVSEDVPVPGGTAAVATALGLESIPDRARFVAELTRLLYDIPEGKNSATDARLRRLSAFLLSLRASQTREAADELVPIPLSAATWGHAIFHRPIAADALFVAILSDRQASLLCHGLSSLDDETLRFLAEHPSVLGRLYERGAAVFAAFGSALRIHDGVVVPAGGETAVTLWEAALGERVDRPERFIRALFEHGDGRVAYLYDTMAQLEPARIRFALGASIVNPATRILRFKALVASTSSAYGEWRVKVLPFARPLNDTAMLLARIRVDDHGRPALGSRALWASAFDAAAGADVKSPAQPSGTAVEGDVDAAWLSAAIVSRDAQSRADRVEQFAFGQRVFADAGDAGSPDVRAALRGFPRARLLMLTLERMGITSPALYADAARQAHRLSSLEADRGFLALAQFQGALALVSRMARVGTIDAQTTHALVSTLVAVPLSDDGRYNGGVARWIGQTLCAAIAPAEDADDGLLAALAGRRAPAGPRDPATLVLWEGHQYRLDLAAAELRRLRRVREKQGSYSVALAVKLDAAAQTVMRDGVTIRDIQALAASLKAIAGELPARSTGERDDSPPGIDSPRNLRDGLERAVRDLSKIDAPKDTNRVMRAVEGVGEAADAVLADALLSYAYALEIGDPDGAALLAGNVARRHDFGYGPRDAGARTRMAWGGAKQELVPGVPWHVSGSLLGLDVALAPLALRRISSDRVVAAPVLTSNERETFAVSVALMNAYALRDADRDAISLAIERGRARVAALTLESFASLAGEIDMDGWRQRATRWMLVHEPARAGSLFSLTELMRLGGGDAIDGRNAWGMTGLAASGCLCVRLTPPGRWTLWTGRPQLGLMGASVADLNLRVALTLHDLRLPAALARHVLTAAVQDFVDEVRPTDPNDWLTLVRAAQQLTRERIEDYLAAATVDGPLMLEGRRP